MTILSPFFNDKPFIGFRNEFLGGTSVGGFTPKDLFRSGEVGVWYDPSDLTTLYQDTTGTTPVTAAGQSVALMLDKSKGLTLGPELVTNGGFDTDSGWTKGTGWAISSGQATHAAGTGSSLDQANVVTAGKWYKVTVDATATGGTWALQFVGGTTTTIGSSLESGSYTLYGLAGTSNTILRIFAGSATALTIDNISVRELAGNHAVQATAAARPIYGVVPKTGRRNLLTYTEQFDNVAWTKANGSITANAIAAPDGTITADAFIDDGSSGVHAANQTHTCLPNTTYTLTCYLKAGARNWATLDPVFPTVANNITYFDLVNGVVGTNDADNTASIENVGNGWYRCRVTHTTGAAQTSLIAQVAPANADGGISYIGNSTAAIYIWGAQIELSSTATAYQRVGSQYDVTEAGVPSLSYLAFDGTDDSMATSAIDFTGTDKMGVFAGVRLLTPRSNNSPLFQIGDATASATDALIRIISGDGSTDAVRAAIFATAVNQTPRITIAYPSTNLYSAVFDGEASGANEINFRINGVNAEVGSATDSGLTSIGSQILYIGRQSSAVGYLNGHIYGLIVRGAQSTDSQITNTETWLNGKTGAY